MNDSNIDPDTQPSGAAVKMRLLGLELSPLALMGFLITVILTVVVLLAFATNMLAMVMQWSDAGGIAQILDAIFK